MSKITSKKAISEGDAAVETRFGKALASAMNGCENLTRIGTLSEKLVHRALKFYIEPDESKHEVLVLGSVADVMNEDGIFEIQTRSFEKIVPKLEKLLKEYKVTVIYPLVASLYINYIDRENGEVTARKKSPKHDTINRAACELYKLAELLPHENLKIRLIFLHIEDFRRKADKKAWQKLSESLIKRIPSAVERETELALPRDYKIFLPEGLGEEFTAKELSALIKLDSRRTHNTLTLLLKLGIIERCGSLARAFVYRKTGDRSPL